MSDLSNKLRTARISAGMTQQQAADVSGIGYKSINNYEKGVSKPDVEKLAVLCKTYNVSADYFINVNFGLGKDELTLPLAKQEQELIKKYRYLDASGQETVLLVLDAQYKRCVGDKSNKKFSKEIC